MKSDRLKLKQFSDFSQEKQESDYEYEFSHAVRIDDLDDEGQPVEDLNDTIPDADGDEGSGDRDTAQDLSTAASNSREGTSDQSEDSQEEMPAGEEPAENSSESEEAETSDLSEDISSDEEAEEDDFPDLDFPEAETEEEDPAADLPEDTLSGSDLPYRPFAGAMCFICWALVLIYRIPASYLIGDEGNNDFSCAFTLFCLFALPAAFAVPALAEKKFSSLWNDGEKDSCVLLWKLYTAVSMAGGILFALIFGAYGIFWTNWAMKTPFALFALQGLMIPLFLIWPAGVSAGFLRGCGRGSEVIAARRILCAGMAVAGLVFSWFGTGYGRKVGAVLGDPSRYASAYGAAGLSCGVLLAVLVVTVLLWIMVLHLLGKEGLSLKRKSRVKPFLLLRETFRRMAVPFAIAFLAALYFFCDQFLFKTITLLQGYSEEDVVSIWGTFSGRFLPTVLLPVLLAAMIAPSLNSRVSGVLADKPEGDTSTALRLSLRFVLAIAIPCGIGFAVLASPMYTVLFPADVSLVALASSITRAGFALGVLYSLDLLLMVYLIALGKSLRCLVYLVITLAAHGIALVLITLFLRIHIYAVILADLLFAVLLLAICLRAAAKFGKVRFQLTSLAAPMGASVVMAAISFGVYYLIEVFSGNTILSWSFAACTGCVIYFAFFFLLKGMTDKELSCFPGGSILAAIADKVNLL